MITGTEFIVGSALGGGLSALGGIFGGRSSAKAAKRAARYQLQATRLAIKAQKEMFERALEITRPYREAGQLSLGKILEHIQHHKPLDVQVPEELKPLFEIEAKEAERSALMQLNKSGMAQSGKGVSLLADIMAKVRAEQTAKGYGLGLERAMIEEDRKLVPLWNLINIGSGQGQAQAQLAAQTGASLANIMSTGGTNLANIYMQAGAQRGAYIQNALQGISNHLMSGLGTYMNYMQNRTLNDAITSYIQRLGSSPMTFNVPASSSGYSLFQGMNLPSWLR